MAKRLNLFILMMLIVSQTILGPFVSTSAVLAEGVGGSGEQEKLVEDQKETVGNEEVDTDELEKLLKNVEQYEEDSYEADSFEAFVAAITVGKETYEDDDATEEDVNDAIDEVEEAVKGLQEKKPEEDESNSTGKEQSPDTKDEENSDKDKAELDDNEGKSNKVNEVKRLANEEPKEITENIIDEILLKREDGSIYEDGDLLDLNEDLELGLEWSLPNDAMYKGGDTFTFPLPEQLEIYSEITGDLGDFGTFVVGIDGKVTFTFNDKINENSNVKGTFWVKTALDKQKIKTTTEELEIIFNEEVAKKTTINIKPEGGQAIHKEGKPVGGNFNTDEIEWTVLINTTREELKNAIITDPIGDGQELVLDSIELTEIEVDLSGNEVPDLGEKMEFTSESTIEELKLVLGDTNKAYKLKFKTKIKDSEKDKEGRKGYSNTAFLNSDGKEEKQSGASVSVQRPESLTKSSSSFNKDDRSVEWEVNANFTEKSLKKDDEIVDEFTFTIGDNDRSDAFEVKKEDIEILQVDSFEDDGKVDATSDATDLFDISIDGNKVTYKLKEDTNKAFIIKYKTKAKEGAYIDNDGKISNTVKIDGNTKTSEQHVGQQVGVKGSKGIDYENKTIDWEITINADKQDLRNFVLTDDFSGSGQQLVDGSIEISPEARGANISPNTDGEGFEIDFGDITETYTITYKTEFTYDFEGEKMPSFHNDVYISYETKDGTEYELEIDNNVDPNNNTKNNGVKNGTANNETKEITWTVDVNYNNLTLTDAKVIDEIADNQSLIDGSVKIYETSIASDGNIITGDDVTENFTVTSEENLVEVLFGGEINQSYRIEFKTKDKDDIYNSGEVYENTAQFIPRDKEAHNLKATVTLPNQGEFLGKSGLHNKKDWTVDWTIDVNKSKSKLTHVTVKDDLGIDGPQILLEDSFKVTKAGSDEELDEDAYELNIEGNSFTLIFPGEITDHYKVTYSSYILAGETADLKNEAEIESVEETIVGAIVKEEVVEVKISTGGGTAEGATGGLTLEKTEKDTNRALKKVKFKLLKTIGNQEIVVREGKTDEEGKLEWSGLKYGDYTLVEEIPDGYTGVESQKVTINNDSLKDGVLTLKDEIVNDRKTGIAKIVKTDAVTGEKLSGAAFKITNETTGQSYTLTTEEDGTITEEVPFGEYTVEEVEAPNGYRTIDNIENITIEIDKTTEVTIKNEAFVNVNGEKTWITSEDEGKLDSITVELLKNGKKIAEKEVSASDNWKYSFIDLDKYDKNGKEIEYAIAEIKVDNYNTHQDGHNLINIETTEISGEKTWLDNNSNERPDKITIKLLADGKKVEQTEVTAENDWKYEFTNLDKFDKDGEEIKYTIEEKSVDGYETTIDGFNISNLRVGETEVSGTKTWLDDNSEDRPKDITVILLANGEETDQSVTVSADSDWKYEFTKLDKYDDQGKEIVYTVDEEDIEGYEKSFDGKDITNLRVGKTEVTGEKNWVEVDERYRPDSITVQLLANGKEKDTIEVSANTDWSYGFTGLEKYDEQGIEITYTVEELDVPTGYTSKTDGYTITNTQEFTEVTVEKGWKEVNSEYRPDSITVQLLANGEEEKTVEVSQETDWTYEFTDLAKYDKNGKEIEYTVEEPNVPAGYTAEVDGYTITNTQKLTEVSGEKIWDEVDERYRPDSITVQLLANGEEEDTIEVSQETNWTYVFTDLAQYDKDGKEIEYTVEEPNVPVGYASEVDGYTITNTQQSTKVSGEKLWDEVDEHYRPDNVTIQLLANGEEETTVKVSDETDWTYEFNDLAKYDKDGEKIEYTVAEVDVPVGYDSDVEGYNITNTQKSTEISGTKTWLDDNSEERPDVITVQLKNGEEVVDEQEVTAEEKWKYTFTDLAKYDKSGKEISYTVDEVAVDGYEKSIEGNDITNLRVGTTEVGVTKLWKDEDETNRPDTITVNLLQNGTPYKEHEVTKDNDWELTITELPKYDKEGKLYEYSVTEHDVPGYAAEVAGFEITNTRADVKTIEITKSWLDDDSKERPDSIEIELFRSITDGEKELVDTYMVTADDDWSLEIKDLDAFDPNGNAYTYEVDELTVEGYETIVNGFDITNLRIGTTSVEGTKTWEDGNSKNRPSSITVELLQNGEKIDEVEVTEEMDWKFSFTDLEEFDENGVAYVYTVAEQEVAGYTAKIDGYDITNTLIETPSKDEESDHPEGFGQTKPKGDASKEGLLPKTATNTFNMLLTGALLLMVGAGIVIYRRRKTE